MSENQIENGIERSCAQGNEIGRNKIIASKREKQHQIIRQEIYVAIEKRLVFKIFALTVQGSLSQINKEDANPIDNTDDY